MKKPCGKHQTEYCSTLDNLPNGLLEEYVDVTLAIDIMYINKSPFMMTTSRAIHYGTAYPR